MACFSFKPPHREEINFLTMLATATAPSLHVFLSGFGAPHVDEKRRIFRNNKAVIEASAWSRVRYTVCCYDDTDWSEWEHDASITVIREKGIVGQFLHRHLVPGTPAVDGFDYLLLLLDDVELTPRTVHLTEMIRWMNEFQLDVISPCMTMDSKVQFDYMKHDSTLRWPAMRVTTVLEYFCYLTRPIWYSRYYRLIDPVHNPWGWNLDMMLYKRFGFRVGVLNHMLMKHWYKGESYASRQDANPHDGAAFVLRKWGVTAHELATQPAVRYLILSMEDAGP